MIPVLTNFTQKSQIVRLLHLINYDTKTYCFVDLLEVLVGSWKHGNTRPIK